MGKLFSPRFLSREGRILPGQRRIVNVPAPAAGADWAVVVPGGRNWRIAMGTAQISTSATVTNRAPLALVTDGTETLWEYGNGAELPASQTALVSLASTPPPVGFAAQVLSVLAPFPDAWIPGGFTLGTVTLNLQAGDQWSKISLYVEEYWYDDKGLSDERFAEDQIIMAAAQQAGV